MNKLYIWSDIPGDFFKASCEGDARTQSNSDKNAETKVRIEKVMSVNDLIRLFRSLCDESIEWNSVNFHTHGTGGAIALGSTFLDLDSYVRLENNDFGRLFAKDCVITFEGCEVADGADGEYFLIEIARTLLINKGGKVRGNTNFGFGNIFTGGDSSHPFGTWVSANLSVGGALNLVNGKHLHRDNIFKKIKALSEQIARCEKYFRQGEKQRVEKAKLEAEVWMRSESWQGRWQAARWLDTAEKILKEIELRQPVFVYPTPL